jgi:hypothetical protein
MPTFTIKTYDSDFYHEVAAGNVPGQSIVHKYGRNPNGSLGTEATVSDLGEIQMPTTASAMRIKAGGNAADTAAGAGAQEVTIYGQDENYELAEEAVATAGARASTATTTTFIRVFRARVTSSGSYQTTGTGTGGTNQGAITIEDSGGAADYIRIPQYEGTSEYAAYHVPANKKAYLLGATIDVDATRNADVILYKRTDASDTTGAVSSRRVQLYFDGVAGSISFAPESPIALGADCDVWWSFIPTANGTECSVDFELLLEDTASAVSPTPAELSKLTFFSDYATFYSDNLTFH